MKGKLPKMPASLVLAGMSHYKVDEDLYLVIQQVSDAAPAVPVERPTHHVIVIDCSGSMGYDLPALRSQLKNKLTTLVGEHDIVSLVWFSGRGQCAALFAAKPVANAADLATLCKAIDRWLVPVGMTGFIDPFALAAELASTSKVTHPNHATSLVAMTDGQHNDGPRSEVFAAVAKAADVFDAAVCVAYGWYADQDMLGQIAEKLGGNMVLARDFAGWEPVFESAMKRRPTGAKRAKVPVTNAVGGFAYAIDGGDLLTFAAEGGHALVPADLGCVAYLSREPVGSARGPLADVARDAAQDRAGKHGDEKAVKAAYAAAALYGARVQPKVVKPLLRAIGDVSLAEMGATAFGKQKTADFVELATGLAIGTRRRFAKGYDRNCTPRADAFTVLDLLSLLAKDEGCRFHPDHPEFTYDRISRARVDASDKLTAEDLAQIEAAWTKAKGDPTAEGMAELEATIAAVKAARPKALKFVADPAPEGFPMSSLVPNSESPNMSICIRINGRVDLGAVLDDIRCGVTRLSDPEKQRNALAAAARVPNVLRTHIHRNYAIIADGLVNAPKLPVSLSAVMWSRLQREGFDLGPYKTDEVYVLDISKLPVLNEQQVVELSAEDMLKLAYEMETQRAKAKVFKHYLNTLFPKISEGLVSAYGTDAAKWLEEQGIRDSGFSPPHTTQAPSTDVRTARLLEVSFAGHSTEPPVDKVRDRMEGREKSKQPAFGVLMEEAIREVDAFTKQGGFNIKDTAAQDVDGKATIEAWLKMKASACEREVREAQFALSKAAFITIVAPSWFKEWPTLGDVSAKDAEKGVVAIGEMEIKGKAGAVKGTIKLKEKQVKI